MPKAFPLLATAVLALSGAAGGAEVRSGTVRFEPTRREAEVPEIFRLEAHEFEFEQRPSATVSRRIAISRVTFPSPVLTPHPKNNTVHCEYFRPLGTGRKVPGVVVLHILGGDFDLSRLVGRQLAYHGVAALFLKLPYYGPRRDEGTPARMVSLDPRRTVEGMRQGVLDIRRAAAWLASREEIDRERLGITGISLGGITGALAACSEPRFKRVALLLAGGDVGQVAWEAPEMEPVRKHWIDQGGTRESFFALLRQVDPVTYARAVSGREVLLINARSDRVIPPACAEALWRAFGRPQIVWLPAGHYTAMRYLFEELARVTRFFQGRWD